MSETKQILPFQPSTLETVDRAFYRYIKDLELHTETSQGWRLAPVVWAGAERAAQWKNDPDRRDLSKTIIKPVISLRRVGKAKNSAVKGTFFGNVPPWSDAKGHSITISRRIQRKKTNNFATKDSFRRFGDPNFPFKNEKVVYEDIQIPQPVYVGLSYEIKIETNHQQQMNDLVQPFMTRPGSINQILLREDGHRYEAFIQEDFTEDNNLDDLGEDERTFSTSINVLVHGKLIGDGKNDERPAVVVRENAVEVKFPRERVILGDNNVFDRNGFFRPDFKIRTPERFSSPTLFVPNPNPSGSGAP